MFHRFGGEVEVGRDVSIAEALGEQLEDLEFAWGQVGSVGPRARAWAAWQVAGTQLAQSARHDAGGGLRAETLQSGMGFAQRSFVI
jgi:hypothetical protein